MKIDQKKVRYFQTSFKAIPVEEAQIRKSADGQEIKGTVIKGYASTPTLDRYNDVVQPEAFRKSIMGNYRKNPIILFQHDSHRPIGKATFMNIDTKGLYIEALIVDAEIEPKIQAGILTAFSIGYIPLAMEFQNEAGDQLNPFEDNVWADDVKRIITEVDLVENSIVSVPANPDALFTMEKSVKKMFEDMKKDHDEEKCWSEDEKSIYFTVEVKKDFTTKTFERILVSEKSPEVFARAFYIAFAGKPDSKRFGLIFPKKDWTLEGAKNWKAENIYNLISKGMKNLLDKKDDEQSDNGAAGSAGTSGAADDGTADGTTKEPEGESGAAQTAGETPAKPAEGAGDQAGEKDGKGQGGEKPADAKTDGEEGTKKPAGAEDGKAFVIDPKLVTPENLKTALEAVVDLKAKLAEKDAKIAALSNEPEKKAQIYSQFGGSGEKPAAKKDEDEKKEQKDMSVGFKDNLMAAAV